MSEKPGVMIYFDMLDCLKQMTDRQAGLLFRCILEYASTGKEPEIPDSLRIIWPMLRMRMDTDHQRYKLKVLKSRYAIYKRWAEKKEETVLPYEDWVYRQEDVEEYQLKYL